MANPQRENGHLDLANELVEVLARTQLNGGEFRILLCVLRKTWAWNKFDDWISITQLQKMTRFSRQYVCEIKKSLIEKNILIINNSRVKFNKDYDSWVVNNSLLVNNRRQGSQQQLTVGSQQGVGTQKKSLTKETNTNMRVKFKNHKGKEIEMVTGADYLPDHKSPLDTIQNKRKLERILGYKKTNKWASFIFGTGWDFLKAYEKTQKTKYIGNVLLEEVSKNMVQFYEAGETRETIREMLAAFFFSRKAKDVGITPNGAFSTHTYNLWKQGKLTPPKIIKNWYGEIEGRNL